MTQIAVELVTTLLLLLVLVLLPHSQMVAPSRWRFRRDLLLATLTGVGTAALAAVMMLRPQDSISDWYPRVAESVAGAENLVNAILVDFRAFDTLGEITVLAVAAAGIAVMVRDLRLPVRTRDSAERSMAQLRLVDEPYPLMLAGVARPVLPAALMIAVFLLLRGHHAPGGGFVAGLIAGTALILQQIANGFAWTQARFHPDHFQMIGAGLLLALIPICDGYSTGVTALVFGRPFLSSAMSHGSMPLLGEFKLTSTLAFDVGVLLVVTGTLLLILETLGRLGRNRGAAVQSCRCADQCAD